MARSETYPGSGNYMYSDVQSKAAYASGDAVANKEPGVKMPEIQEQMASLGAQAQRCEKLAQVVRERLTGVLRPSNPVDGCSPPIRTIETCLGNEIAQTKGTIEVACAVLEEILNRCEL